MTDPHIRSFASFDQAIEYMQINEQEANAHLAPEQAALTWGSHFASFIPRDRLVIFGYCMTLDEATADEADAMRRTGDDPDSQEEAAQELEYTRGMLAGAHLRGYLFGRAWSVVEPAGELGSTHRGNAWPISADLFHAAEAAGWEVARMTADAVQELDAVYQAMRAHKLSQR